MLERAENLHQKNIKIIDQELFDLHKTSKF